MVATRNQHRNEKQAMSPSDPSFKALSQSIVAANIPITQRPPPPPVQLPPRIITRTEPGHRYPTTYIHADPSSFKQVVQMLTRSSTKPKPIFSMPTHTIPPIKTPMARKPQPMPGCKFRIFERRKSVNNLNLRPHMGLMVQEVPVRSPSSNYPNFSLSVLSYPSHVLSPNTPLLPDPFTPTLDMEAEERAIKAKDFYLHPSPRGLHKTQKPQLLPLFPVTSPHESGSSLI